MLNFYVIFNSKWTLYFILYITVVAKKNPDFQITTTENVHLTHRHCRRLIITSTVTDAVLYLNSLG